MFGSFPNEKSLRVVVEVAYGPGERDTHNSDVGGRVVPVPAIGNDSTRAPVRVGQTRDSTEHTRARNALLSPLVAICITPSAERSLHSLCLHPLLHSFSSCVALLLVGRAVVETEGHRGHTSADSQHTPAPPMLPPPSSLASPCPPRTPLSLRSGSMHTTGDENDSSCSNEVGCEGI